MLMRRSLGKPKRKLTVGGGSSIWTGYSIQLYLSAIRSFSAEAMDVVVVIIIIVVVVVNCDVDI